MAKRFFALLIACLLPAGLLAACGSAAGPSEETNMQIPNPFIDCASLGEAAELAGFDISVPGKFDGYENKLIQAVRGSMIQVFYYDGDPDAEDSSRILVRKGTGSDDISGDYNSYPEVETVSIHGIDVLIRGRDGLVFSAVWTRDGYSYAINADNGLSREALADAIEEMIAVVDSPAG